MRALLTALLALWLGAAVAIEPQGDTGAHDPTLLIEGMTLAGT